MNDTIYREVTMDAILEMNTEHRASWKDCVLDVLDALPSAQPERKKGWWIVCTESFEETFHTGHRCSACNYWKPMGIWNYCPNCGAYMGGVNRD